MSLYAKDVSFVTEIKQSYLRKVLRDYPMLVSSDVRIEIQNEMALKTVPESAALVVVDFPDPSDVVGRTVIPARFLDVSGDEVKQINLVTKIDARTYFYRATRLIRRGEVVTESDIEQVYEDLRGNTKQRIRQKEDIIGRMTTSTIAKNNLIATYMLKDVPVVHVGTYVNVLIEKEGYDLRVKGRVLDDGGIGEVIRVQTGLESRKVIYGEVLDATTVRYNFID